jgi:hypothetical protein
MKKMLLVIVMLGFGFMVGCSEEPKKGPTSSGTTAVGPQGTVKHDTATPADTTKKP